MPLLLARLLLRRHLGRRLLGRPLLGGALVVGMVLQGCGAPRQAVHLIVVPPSQLAWHQFDPRSRSYALPLLEEYRRLHPDVSVTMTVVGEAELEATLRRRQSQGLGPDLLLLRAPMANALLSRGLVEPLPEGTHTRSTLSLLTPEAAQQIATRQGLSGVPVFSQLTLACFDRRQVSTPPATLEALLALAASGHPIGVSVDPIGIWWSAGALNAQSGILPIITDKPLPAGADTARTRAALLRWLTWLRQLTQQSGVDLANGPRDLVEGLSSGRLSWIPCFSSTLLPLEERLGPHLGVSTLPTGPGGEPTPFATTAVFALGTDSSPQQRQRALDLAALSLSPRVQRALTLASRMLLPVNRFVPVPVASSGRLAALEKAQGQYRRASSALDVSFNADRVQQKLPTIERVITNVMLGALSPSQGADALLRLLPPRR